MAVSFFAVRALFALIPGVSVNSRECLAAALCVQLRSSGERRATTKLERAQKLAWVRIVSPFATSNETSADKLRSQCFLARRS